MKISEKLFEISKQLLEKAQYDSSALDRLEVSAKEFGKSWSGSWLGYHSRVYYKDFNSPPPGAKFSQEWGLMNTPFTRGTVVDWLEYNYDDVIALIYKKAGNPDISKIEKLSKEAVEFFDDLKSEVLSLVISNIKNEEDRFASKILNDIENMKILLQSDFIKCLKPSGQFSSRDKIAVEKGFQAPPHIAVEAQIYAIQFSFKICEDLAKEVKRLASHLSNISKRMSYNGRIGTNIFIGHGRSKVWRELKDFISNRLRLPWDEFNRVPVAGLTNITRLSQMLAQAAFAFLIMTAEDEQKDGTLHARMNVIHEAGLFQGRLGFERAIVLLEEDCEEFSNIHGLGQIRFPKGNISAVFEEIRQILEREELL